MDEPNITPVLEGLVDIAKQLSEALKPQWDARKDIAKTLITLASAALVFTVTFSPSLITKETPPFWRYSIVFCWLAFICSLVLALSSLWFAAYIGNLPAYVMARTEKIKEAARTIRSSGTRDSAPMHAVMEEALAEVVRNETVARRLFYASVVCYGVALLAFTVIGVRQLLR